MSNLSLAVGYLIVVLHQFWDGPKLVPVGTMLDVSRQVRNDLVGGQVARDATDEEVAEYRDGRTPSEEGGDDDRPTTADLAAAQAKLDALETERDALQGAAKALEGQVGTLTGERDALRTELEALKAKSGKGAKPAPAGE